MKLTKERATLTMAHRKVIYNQSSLTAHIHHCIGGKKVRYGRITAPQNDQIEFIYHSNCVELFIRSQSVTLHEVYFEW